MGAADVLLHGAIAFFLVTLASIYPRDHAVESGDSSLGGLGGEAMVGPAGDLRLDIFYDNWNHRYSSKGRRLHYWHR